jgi:hypothetical protein
MSYTGNTEQNNSNDKSVKRQPPKNYQCLSQPHQLGGMAEQKEIGIKMAEEEE